LNSISLMSIDTMTGVGAELPSGWRGKIVLARHYDSGDVGER
jgi:hypothetical protein